MTPAPIVILVVACFRTEPDLCHEVRWDADPTYQCIRQRPAVIAAVERLSPGYSVVSARCVPRFRLAPRASARSAGALPAPTR